MVHSRQSESNQVQEQLEFNVNERHSQSLNGKQKNEDKMIDDDQLLSDEKDKSKKLKLYVGSDQNSISNGNGSIHAVKPNSQE